MLILFLPILPGWFWHQTLLYRKAERRTEDKQKAGVSDTWKPTDCIGWIRESLWDVQLGRTYRHGSAR